VTRRAFGCQLAVAAVSVAAGVLAEGLVSGARLFGSSPSEALRCVLWTLGAWALPGAGAALVLAWALALLCDEESMLETLRGQWSMPARRDAMLLAMFAAPALLAWVYVVVGVAARFRNIELAATSSAFLVLAFVLVLGILALAGWRALGRRRAAGRALGALPALALTFESLVLVWLGVACRGGLAQLDARLLALPVAFALVFAAGDVSERLRARGHVLVVGSGGVALLAWVVFLFSGERATSALANHGAWSRSLLRAGQHLTDFDGDGYSSFLSGGDCAAFDATVNPGAPEVVGDGVDNNCIAGDAGKTSEPHRPSWGRSAHGSPKNLNVIVVTIETLRHDHASFVRAARDTTPTLRGLVPESLVFERMYSAAPLTRLALASLFSSHAPSEIDWVAQAPEKRMRRLGPKTPWLPESLRARGYETIAVLTDFAAFTAQEDAGFERGFQHYDISTKLEYQGGTMWGFPAAQQVDKALAYAQRASRPFLLWLHLFEPHYRYEQPPDAPVFGSDEQARYDAEIWHVDHQLGRLIDGLRELGVWDSTLLFVSGDHGEAFGEHRDRWHGSNLHDPQLRPAALLRVPGITGKRIDVAVTFTDIAPTLARVLGDRQTFDQLRGRSLAPLLHHSALPDEEHGFVAESFSVDDGHAYQAALISYPLKLVYIEAGRHFSLFDLRADPNEQSPLEPTADPRGAALVQQLVGYLERTRAGATR
jgi:choline-sulfatase